MQENDAIQLLETLGLTEYESKSLYSLFKVSEAQAPEISRMAQVPKTRVYDVLERLMKKGLIVEVYGRPKKYRVIESGNAIQALLEFKRKDLQLLEEKALNLKRFLSQNENVSSVNERILKVKTKQDFDKILAEELLKAKTSIKAFTELGKHHLNTITSLKKSSNVDVKIISSKVETELFKSFSFLGAEVKHLTHGLNAFIVDEKKVILALNDFNKAGNEFHFSIWQNNESLGNALTHYFDSCWKKANTLNPSS